MSMASPQFVDHLPIEGVALIGAIQCDVAYLLMNLSRDEFSHIKSISLISGFQWIDLRLEYTPARSTLASCTNKLVGLSEAWSVDRADATCHNHRVIRA